MASHAWKFQECTSQKADCPWQWSEKMGLKAAARINFLQFKASRSWVYKFNKANGIFSRKIAKFQQNSFKKPKILFEMQMHF